ncbi:MAG: hypothetical protein LBH58_03090 [Tannerellaceae bacterium]|jgi:hypothetical protein|nr:hypothetical protein [Tannerellaceae bacterium]
MVNLALSGKWKEWSDKQAIGTVFNITTTGIVDLGDSWGMLDGDGRIDFPPIKKKEEPLWLIAYVAKWMSFREDVTEFGSWYIEQYYANYTEELEKEHPDGEKDWLSKVKFSTPEIDDGIRQDKEKYPGIIKAVTKGGRC